MQARQTTSIRLPLASVSTQSASPTSVVNTPALQTDVTIRLTKPPDPRKLPEFRLWRMTKDGRAVECRARIVPLGDGLPEIRLLMTRSDGTFSRNGYTFKALAGTDPRDRG